MGDAVPRRVRLKTTFGMPCRSLDEGRTAVWFDDEIRVLKRIGSHYLCFVIYGHPSAPASMRVWLHKRAVRNFK